MSQLQPEPPQDSPQEKAVQQKNTRTEYQNSDLNLHFNDLLRWEDEGGACPPEDRDLDNSSWDDLTRRHDVNHAGPDGTSTDCPAPGLGTNSHEEIVAATPERPNPQSQPAIEGPPATFEEFWPAYLAAHSKAATRLVHFIAPPLGLAYAGACLAAGNPLAALAAPLVVYGPIFLSHWLIEGNQPKSFQNALWSARAEMKMVYLGLTGQLTLELEKHQIQPSAQEAPIRKILRRMGIIKSDKPADSQ